MSQLVVVDKTFAELDTGELYAILQLRCDVFVVEQACPYHELDGRDTEASTRHVWFEDRADAPDHPIAAYLRVLGDATATRIGRVVTDPAWRGSGLARRLVEHVLATTTGPVVLDAQSHLGDFYASFGFVAAGAVFIEDDIPHLPMRLDRPS